MNQQVNSGRDWAVRLDAGMYVVRWGTRAHRQHGGVHFVSDTGEWCRVDATPRAMTLRNARRCVAALVRVGCVGAVVGVVEGCAS